MNELSIDEAHHELALLLLEYLGVPELPANDTRIDFSYHSGNGVDSFGHMRVSAQVLPLHHPNIFKFGKAEMLKSKRVFFQTRNTSCAYNTLHDLLVTLRQKWTQLGADIRCTSGVDADGKFVTNIEFVEGVKSVRFHVTT